MSHRITTKTEIKDLTVAKAALVKKGWAFNESGGNLRITSGPMDGANINISNGTITGDTDYGNHRDGGLEALNQEYGVCLVEKQVADQGGYVEETNILENGDIQIIATVSFG